MGYSGHLQAEIIYFKKMYRVLSFMEVCLIDLSKISYFDTFLYTKYSFKIIKYRDYSQQRTVSFQYRSIYMYFIYLYFKYYVLPLLVSIDVLVRFCNYDCPQKLCDQCVQEQIFANCFLVYVFSIQYVQIYCKTVTSYEPLCVW